MAAKNLPEYLSWDALFKENYDHWDYFKGLFSYAT
jgi:hypothetical protein